LQAKRLELLRELVPGAVRVAVLVNPASATTTETTLRDVQTAARAMRLQIQILNASTSHLARYTHRVAISRQGASPATHDLSPGDKR
jgi:ABC-type uncharacterized transport system substrate-binding protein